MAVSNFGISFGAFALSKVDQFGGLQSIFLVVGGGITTALILMVTAKYPRRPEFYERTAANLHHDEKLKPRID